MLNPFWILLASAFTIGLVHALAPDHWVPFVAIGRAQGWSKGRMAFISFVSGLGHVGSSVAIGGIGTLLGLTLASIENLEGRRGTIAGLLLVGFGAAYLLWGLGHRHVPADEIERGKVVTTWALVAILVLGPCEPLVPLMFLAIEFGWRGVWAVSIVFGLVTIAMMMGQSLAAYTGFKLIKADFLEEHSHAIAGGVILLTGLLAMAFGL